MTRPTDLPPTEAQRDIAAQWLLREDGAPLTPAEQAQLQSWLNTAPSHQVAYDDARHMWQAMETPARNLATRRGEHLERLIRNGRRKRPVIKSLSWALAACIALVSALPLLPELGGFAQNLRADAATDYGQSRTIALPDGSQVMLAGNSAITMQFDNERRQVTVLRGEAFFDVKSGLPQPFTVQSGGAWARVVGTAFNMRASGKVVQIAVDHGIVDVGGIPQNGSLRLTAGQVATVTAGLPAPQPDADLAAITAWRSGRMVFYRTDLQEVVTRLEEQQPGRIVITDGALARRKVSGAFPAQDTEGTLAAIADTLGVRTIHLSPWLTLLY